MEDDAAMRTLLTLFCGLAQGAWWCTKHSVTNTAKSVACDVGASCRFWGGVLKWLIRN